MLFGRNIISPTDFRSALISPLLWERFCVGQIFLLRFRQIFRFSFREIFLIIDFPRRPLLLLRTDTRLTLFGIRKNWKYFILGTNIYPFVLDCSFWALSVFSFERKNNILGLWLLLLLFKKPSCSGGGFYNNSRPCQVLVDGQTQLFYILF